MRLSPAAYVIKQFKGVRATARALDRSPSSIVKWQKKKGLIPNTMQSLVYKVAESKGLDISYRDLIEGREVPE